MEFVAVQAFNNYIEAHIAMGYLQQQHINCWLKDEYTVTIDPVLANAIGGIKLMVVKVQVPRAIELLKAVAAKDQQAYACPHCGSTAIQLTEAPQEKNNWFIALFKIIFNKTGAVNQVWHCYACGKNSIEPVPVTAPAMEDAP